MPVPRATTALAARSAERAAGLSGPFDQTIEVITSGLDTAAPELRGRIVHEYLQANGYFSDPALAESLYQQNPGVDAYLDNLSLQRAAQGGGPSQGVGPGTIANVALGFAGGVLASVLFASMT